MTRNEELNRRAANFYTREARKDAKERTTEAVARTEADIAQCKYEAQLATPQSRGDPIASGLSDGLRQVDLRNQCLQIRGYRQR